MSEVKQRNQIVKPVAPTTPAPAPIRFTLVYMTGRAQPMLGLTLEPLARQIQAQMVGELDRVELVIVDGCPTRNGPSGEDRVALASAVTALQGKLVPRYVRPKPNIWQGPYRVTDRDWWATANARNTAICVATTDYLVFLDDRAYLGPRWLETVIRYYRSRDAVVCGTYDKLELARPPLEPGTVRAVDHRRQRCPDGKRDCGGGWLFGCTFALPLAWALEVNGLEEGCDGLTGEDYTFGLMLGNSGRRIDFDVGMYVEQNRIGVVGKSEFSMRDKGIAPNDKSHAALARFGARKRTEFTPDLTKLRAELARGVPFPIPSPAIDYRDWFDGQPIREIKPPA